MLHFRHFSTIAAIAMLPLVSGPAIAQVSDENDESIPRNIVLRLLNPISFGTERQELLVGQWPDSLPVDLPLPDGAEVVASVVTSGNSYRILLDVPQSPAQVRVFYQEQLEAAGWQSRSYGYRARGFVESGFELTNFLHFCRDATGPLLGITAGSAQAATDLQLNLYVGDNSGCDPQLVVPQAIDNPMPVLVSPPESIISSPRGGGSGDYWLSGVDLETELEIESLMAHYGDQWEQAGWTQIADNQTDRTFWSLWRWQDEAGQSWQGTLSMTQLEEMPGQYKATAIVIEQ